MLAIHHNHMEPISDIQTIVITNMPVETFHLKYFILSLSFSFLISDVPFIHFDQLHTFLYHPIIKLL